MTALARRAGSPVLLLALWQLAAAATAGQFLLAGPVAVGGWLADNPGLVGRALSASLANAAWGFLAGNLAAILIATVAMLWPRALNLLSGLALVVFCLPLVATGPILRVTMGPGNGPQIVLAALAVFYTTLIPLLAGLRAAPSVWFDLVASYGRGRLAALIHVRARASLPYLLAGLQIAAPAAFLGAMVGEFTGAERGLGVLTIRFTRDLNVPALWAVASVAAAVSIAAYGGIGALGRRFLLERPPVILAPPRLSRGSLAGRLQGCVLLAGVTLALWWGGIELFGLNPFFAKRPPDLLAALTRAPDAAATRQALLGAAGQTAALVLPGYLAGLALGAGLAVTLSLAPRLSGLVTPLAVALRSVPIVTTAPLVVLMLGRGAAGTIALVALMVFFPTFVACQHGLRQAPGQILDILRGYGAGGLAQLIHVRIPAMLPAFFAAARMGVPAAILAVTVAEWLATGRGLGNLMTLSASLSDYTMLWLTVVLVTGASVLGHGGIAWIERRVLRLYAPEQVDP
ncbi:ABC transporter permease subunit [Paracoccus sp. YIM 132242]|uniref:ABC transporter permease subunit n=1 Tax=Paracoccus lichenicola TaxID=2665644 RepID=A0A6L6HLB8_9RHOB|nr:ABC transporter permease subunit [Paracoccus lichenicola]MTD98854.1 ABC transporter permease subunit [Paracoccus lichenicola]